MSLHIGTSGWAYKEWKPAFYPADVPQDRFLEHYGSVLSACEINATFYRLQSESVVARWANAVPQGFRFAVKAHRRLTHTRQMAWNKEEQEFLRRFLESIAPLGERFGALLLQYPPTRPRDDDGLAAVLDLLPQGVSFAMEFRHDSWVADDVFDAIAARVARSASRRHRVRCWTGFRRDRSRTSGCVPTATTPRPVMGGSGCCGAKLPTVRCWRSPNTRASPRGIRSVGSDWPSGWPTFTSTNHPFI